MALSKIQPNWPNRNLEKISWVSPNWNLVVSTSVESLPS